MTNDNTVSIEEITSIQAESARLQREVLSMQKENALEMQEISRRFVETDRKFVETDRKFAETKVYLDQVLARADKVFAMAGNLTNNIGDVAEEFFYQGLSTSMALGGMHFDMIDRRIKNHVGTLQGEYDLVLYNGNSVALVEVKHKLHPNDVDRFANKALPNFSPFVSRLRRPSNIRCCRRAVSARGGG